ncbi:MAG: hypothetical protein PVG03_14540 [Desulfarculaceae bacterium]|jgi:hypothetical protein
MPHGRILQWLLAIMAFPWALGLVPAPSLAGPGEGGLSVEAVSSSGQALNVSVKVFKSGSKQLVLKEKGANPTIKTAPGDYDLVIKHLPSGSTERVDKVRVQAGQTKSIKVKFPLGRLGGFVKRAKGTKARGHIAIWKIKDGGKEFVGSGTTYTKPYYLFVTPGTYEMVLKDIDTGKSRTFSNINVKKGEDVLKQAEFD